MGGFQGLVSQPLWNFFFFLTKEKKELDSVTLSLPHGLGFDEKIHDTRYAGEDNCHDVLLTVIIKTDTNIIE